MRRPGRRAGRMAEAIVVIGPSGNGKSTLGRAIAERLGWHFIEGDDHHPPGNIARMARGEPLTDEDRAPFLDSIGRALAASDGAVAACSALKRSYRDRLVRLAGKPVLFVLPRVPRDELQRRMERRTGHFMPTALLESQLATFEEPAPDENAVIVDGTLPAQLIARSLPDDPRRGR